MALGPDHKMNNQSLIHNSDTTVTDTKSEENDGKMEKERDREENDGLGLNHERRRVEGGDRDGGPDGRENTFSNNNNKRLTNADKRLSEEPKIDQEQLHAKKMVPRTVIMVTHALQYLPLCDRVIVCESGKMVYSGPFRFIQQILEGNGVEKDPSEDEEEESNINSHTERNKCFQTISKGRDMDQHNGIDKAKDKMNGGKDKDSNDTENEFDGDVKEAAKVIGGLLQDHLSITLNEQQQRQNGDGTNLKDTLKQGERQREEPTRKMEKNDKEGEEGRREEKEEEEERINRDNDSVSDDVFAFSYRAESTRRLLSVRHGQVSIFEFE